MRYEGEGAWENRGMAQVPFYNSGKHVARQQTPAGQLCVTTSLAFLNHKSIRRPQHSIYRWCSWMVDGHGHLTLISEQNRIVSDSIQMEAEQRFGYLPLPCCPPHLYHSVLALHCLCRE